MFLLHKIPQRLYKTQRGQEVGFYDPFTISRFMTSDPSPILGRIASLTTPARFHICSFHFFISCHSIVHIFQSKYIYSSRS